MPGVQNGVTRWPSLGDGAQVEVFETWSCEGRYGHRGSQTQRLIANFMSASAPVEEYRQQGGPLSPQELHRPRPGRSSSNNRSQLVAA